MERFLCTIISSYGSQLMPSFYDKKLFRYFIALLCERMYGTDNIRLLNCIGDATEGSHSDL